MDLENKDVSQFNQMHFANRSINRCVSLSVWEKPKEETLTIFIISTLNHSSDIVGIFLARSKVKLFLPHKLQRALDLCINF